MAVTASQLIAEITAVGATEAEAQMTALSAASDATALSFATVEEASTAASVGESALAANMAELSAMTAEGAAAADAAAASLTTVGDAAASDIPSVAELDAQFTAMQATLASSFATIDAESAAMLKNAEANATAGMTFKDLEAAQKAASEGQSAMLGGMQQMGAAIGPVILIAGALSAVLAGVAAHMAGDFQAGITTLETGAGELDKNLGMVSQGILQMAVDTGTSTQQLIAGMYEIESAGFRGAQGLLVLQAAAEGARVGEASLADTANGVTTEMTDYHLSADQAAYATNILVEAVKEGKSHMQDMATALATVLPAAHVAGVGLRDVMAAMATMTMQGTPAAQAATYLKQTILALEAPSKGAAKTLAEVGLTTQQVATEMKKSLPDALTMITDAIAKKFPPGSAAYIAALKSIVGGTKQLQGILELTGGNMKNFQANLAGITGAVNKGKGGIAGWSKVQGDFNFQLSKAGAAVEVLFIKIGSMLLPVLSKILGAITPVISRFAAWVSSGNNLATFMQKWAPLLTAAAVLIGGILVFALGAYTVAAVSAAIATLGFTWPILAVIAAVALLAAGIVLAVQHWGAISGWLKGAWSATLNWFGTALKNVEQFFVNVWHSIQSVTSSVWNAIVSAVKKGAQAVFLAIFGPFIAIGQLFIWLYNHNTYFKKLIDTITNIVKTGLTWLHNAWDTIVQFIIAQWNRLKDLAQIVFQFILTMITGKITQTKTNISNIWTAIVAIFQGLWNRLVTPLLQVANNIINWAKNLATQAIQWGKNLVQNFINGLLSMLGQLLQAAANLAGAVAKALGFHSPTEYGPGKDADKWAPNFIKMYVRGLMAGIPLVQAAFDALVNPMGRSLNLGIGGSGMRFSAMGGGSGQAINITIKAAPIYLDSRELVSNGIGLEIARQYWIQNGIHQML